MVKLTSKFVQKENCPTNMKIKSFYDMSDVTPLILKRSFIEGRKKSWNSQLLSFLQIRNLGFSLRSYFY